MYSMAHKAREAMKGKAKRLAGEKDQKVDSSNWTPAEPLNADVKTGMRPISQRQFKKGGKVTGAKAHVHAGRKPRKSGGRALTADSLMNRDQKEANAERPGKKHVGALKTGGRAHRDMGGGTASGILKPYIDAMMHGLKSGGRAKKAFGGPGMPPASGAGPDPRMLAIMKAKAAAAKGMPVMPGRPAPMAMPRAAAPGMPPMKKGGKVPKKAGGGERSAADRIRDNLGYNSPDYEPKTDPSYKPTGGPSQQDKDRLREMSEEAHKRGGRAKRKDGGNVHYGPQEDEAGKKAPSTKQQIATEKHDQNLSKPSRAKAKHYDYGGIVPAAQAPMPNVNSPSFLKFTGAQATPALKKGGKVSHMEWEHSKQDLREDRKLAKKHGMTLEHWENSKLDEKHDKQQSMKGLKHGGKAGKWIQGAIEHKGALHKSLHVPMGEKIPAKKLAKAEHSSNPKLAKRAHLAETLKHLHRANKFGGGALSEGKAPKGKAKGTHINIMINPKGADAGMPGLPPGLPPGMPGMPPAGGPPAGGGVPVPMGMPPMGGGMPMGGAPMGAPPMPPAGGMHPMPRKAGGKVYSSYKDMDAGAGSGLGRIEKTEIQKRRG